MEDEGLADVAPVADGTEVLDKHQEQQHEHYADKGINGIDEEHHDQTTQNAQGAGMPREATERGSRIFKSKKNTIR